MKKCGFEHCRNNSEEDLEIELPDANVKKIFKSQLCANHLITALKRGNEYLLSAINKGQLVGTYDRPDTKSCRS